MIMNGNTFANSSFQIDTRPLYITFTYDSATSKYVPDVDYTAQQIIKMSRTRQVIAEVEGYFAPLVSIWDNGENSLADFTLFQITDPTDLSCYSFVRARRAKDGWDVEYIEA